MFKTFITLFDLKHRSNYQSVVYQLLGNADTFPLYFLIETISGV